MFLRVLIVLLLVYLALWVLYHLLMGKRSEHGKPGSSRGKGVPPAEEMVLDPQCQSYLPKSEALCRNGHYFCSEECARRFLSPKGQAEA